MKREPDVIPLARLPRALIARYGDSVTYSSLYLGVVNGRIPAEFVRGRWQVSSDSLPLIARHFALPRNTAAR